VDAVTVLLSLGAALGFAVAAALKHRSAGDLLESPTLSVPAVGRFVGATVRHPLWWAGTAVDVVAVALHIMALHPGALAVVQPLLVTVLVFGLAVRSVGGGAAEPETAVGRAAQRRTGRLPHRRRDSHREWRR
jgi:hypothetical protein